MRSELPGAVPGPVEEVTAAAAPKPIVIPPGFTEYEETEGFFAGKRAEGERWVVTSEWSQVDGFELCFWTKDDNNMSVAESQEYVEAILKMGEYVTSVKNSMVA